MTRFTVDTDEIERVAASLEAMLALSQRLLAEVDALAATVSTQWSGQANSRFLALHAEWADGARLMTTGITTIHHATTTAHTNYRTATDTTHDLW